MVLSRCEVSSRLKVRGSELTEATRLPPRVPLRCACWRNSGVVDCAALQGGTIRPRSSRQAAGKAPVANRRYMGTVSGEWSSAVKIIEGYLQALHRSYQILGPIEIRVKLVVSSIARLK